MTAHQTRQDAPCRAIAARARAALRSTQLDAQGRTGDGAIS